MATQIGPLNTPGKDGKLSASHSCSVSKVRVVIRVRPFLPREISEKNGDAESCISVFDSELKSCDEVTVHLKDQETSRNECFKLDAFFGQEDNNISKIFQEEVKPLISGIFKGCNATVFAYGATGSGKTYTMQGSEESPGLMPLAVATILSICHNTESRVKISYYEIYMDKCYDLLELKEREIAIFDDKDGQIHLRGLAQVRVNSISEFHQVFSCAIQRRKVGQTSLNDVSSRSHGVLVISVSTPCDDDSGKSVDGKLNLIDLAGNEDNKKTCNEGIRLYESAKINQSLFALSNVIYALNNNKPRIPYRENRLTRILQDSLGGTSRALMVACLNPGEYQESVRTVSLASRSRHISNFVSSAQKKDAPSVSMEAKLREWLESKSKTKNAQMIGRCGSPVTIKSPTSVSSLKKPKTGWSSAKRRIDSNQGASTSVAHRNLFNHGGPVDPGKEVNMKLLSPIGYCTDEPAIREQKMATGKCSTGPSPVSAKTKSPQSPLRKVLSPIDSNIKADDIISEDQPLVSSDLKTPKTPFIHNGGNDQFEGTGNPLEKFHTRSTNLKGTLVQEYIEFLNTATREELLELKGIGQKMAEYITDLRETSPLKSLNDLEKLGLSSKQVHNMFSRAARGVFG
ncbi:kinesin-like protein KIN-10B isoform X1 [Coffea arabica]|uniref:Kinesin-like protein n=1 Tax=Coffea arabica TaxID=13443 RepID=A0ABM4ULG2_COFAR|nr:kinesin-like protein KIN-10B [Coffea arabica]